MLRQSGVGGEGGCAPSHRTDRKDARRGQSHHASLSHRWSRALVLNVTPRTNTNADLNPNRKAERLSLILSRTLLLIRIVCWRSRPAGLSVVLYVMAVMEVNVSCAASVRVSVREGARPGREPIAKTRGAASLTTPYSHSLTAVYVAVGAAP